MSPNSHLSSSHSALTAQSAASPPVSQVTAAPTARRAPITQEEDERFQRLAAFLKARVGLAGPIGTSEATSEFSRVSTIPSVSSSPARDARRELEERRKRHEEYSAYKARVGGWAKTVVKNEPDRLFGRQCLSDEPTYLVDKGGDFLVKHQILESTGLFTNPLWELNGPHNLFLVGRGLRYQADKLLSWVLLYEEQTASAYTELVLLSDERRRSRPEREREISALGANDFFDELVKRGINRPHFRFLALRPDQLGTLEQSGKRTFDHAVNGKSVFLEVSTDGNLYLPTTGQPLPAFSHDNNRGLRDQLYPPAVALRATVPLAFSGVLQTCQNFPSFRSDIFANLKLFSIIFKPLTSDFQDEERHDNCDADAHLASAVSTAASSSACLSIPNASAVPSTTDYPVDAAAKVTAWLQSSLCDGASDAMASFPDPSCRNKRTQTCRAYKAISSLTTDYVRSDTTCSDESEECARAWLKFEDSHDIPLRTYWPSYLHCDDSHTTLALTSGSGFVS
ncbi:Proteophosphoglycan 5 [Rhodotorula toruloides]